MRRDLNYKSQLVDYIKTNLKKGYTKESLTWALVNQDHSKIEIEKALQRAEEELAHEAPLLKTKPQIKYELVGSQPIQAEAPQKESLWKRLFG